MLIQVYKYAASDASNEGISHFVDDVRLLRDGEAHVPRYACVRLVKFAGNLIAVPEYPDGDPRRLVQHMDGGTFVWSCDSRFRELVRRLRGFDCDAPVPLHDRIEGEL